MLILFYGIFLVNVNCGLTERAELYRVENENYIIICYRIYTPATDPFCVEINEIDLSNEKNGEMLLVRVIAADSARIEFISVDSLFMEFYNTNTTLDTMLIVNLRYDNFPIKIRGN